MLCVRLGGYRINQENHMTMHVTTTHLVRTSKVRRWKRSPEFRERMAQVLQQVAEFQPAKCNWS